MTSALATQRRRTELGLIALAGLTTALLYALAGLGRSASLPADLGSFLLLVLALGVVAHLAVRRFAPHADPIILPVVVFLNGLGQVFIIRLSHESGIADELPALQTTWTALGVGAFVATLIIVRRPRDLAAHRYTFGLIGIGLLMLPMLPVVGREINGARIWASIGPINLQPGEFARLALAIFLAAYLVENRELLQVGSRRIGRFEIPDGRHLAPVLAAWGVSLLVLVAEKDLGSSLLYYALFVVLLWVATERPAFLIIGGGLFVSGAVVAWRIFAHVQDRVDIWFDPWATRSGSGYQLVEAA
ncbi:MAG: FtsW/RodA/SpoVE family cell cycle protein, partial [Acidimicrobiales bacterium]